MPGMNPPSEATLPPLHVLVDPAAATGKPGSLSESSNSDLGPPADAAGPDGVQTVPRRASANSGIEYPGQHDVKLGRGGDANSHTGNIKFRELIAKYKPRYIAASRSNKPFVAEEVVQVWRKLDPPGRFLVRTDPSRGDDSTWHDVGDKRARKKASQALREKDRSEDLAASSLQMQANLGLGVPGMPSLAGYTQAAVPPHSAVTYRAASRARAPLPVALAPNVPSKHPAPPANTTASISASYVAGAARGFEADQSRKRTSEFLQQMDLRRVVPRTETAAPVATVQSLASEAKPPAIHDPAVTRALQQLLEQQRQQQLAPASTPTATQVFQQPWRQQQNGASPGAAPATAPTGAQVLHELLRLQQQAQQPRTQAPTVTPAAQALQQLLGPHPPSSTTHAIQQLFGHQQRPPAHILAAAAAGQLPASQGLQLPLDQQGAFVQAIQQLLGQQGQNPVQPPAAPQRAPDQARLLAAVQLLLEGRQAAGNQAQAPMASSSLAAVPAAASTAAIADASAVGSSLSPTLAAGSSSATTSNGVASAPMSLLQPLQFLVRRPQWQQTLQQQQQQSAAATLTSAIQALLQSSASPATTQPSPQQQPWVGQLQQLQHSTSVFQPQPQRASADGSTHSFDPMLASQILETLLNQNANSNTTNPSSN